MRSIVLAIFFGFLMSDVAVADCVTVPFKFWSGAEVTTAQTTSGGYPCRSYFSAGTNTMGTSLSVASPPSHGRVIIEGADARYQPQTGYKGFDSYKIKVCGRTGPSGRIGCALITYNTTVE